MQTAERLTHTPIGAARTHAGQVSAAQGGQGGPGRKAGDAQCGAWGTMAPRRTPLLPLSATRRGGRGVARGAARPRRDAAALALALAAAAAGALALVAVATRVRTHEHAQMRSGISAPATLIPSPQAGLDRRHTHVGYATGGNAAAQAGAREKETDELALARVFARGERLLLLHAYHGLSNRLRASASALALARASQRRAVLVWEPDVHVGCEFEDLFEVDESRFDVLSSADMDSLRAAADASGLGLDEYDYMAPGGKNARVDDSSPRHVYVRSAFTLVARTFVRYDDINRELRSLRPTRAVSTMVESYVDKFGGSLSGVAGVHVRMEANQTRDIPGINALGDSHPAGLAAMGEAAMWRVRCHYLAFVPRLQAYADAHPSSRFLLATDSPKAIDAITAALGGEGAVLLTDAAAHARCAGPAARGRDCQRFALAELLLLGRTEVRARASVRRTF